MKVISLTSSFIVDLQDEYKRRGLADNDLGDQMDVEPEDFFDRAARSSFLRSVHSEIRYRTTCAIL